MACGPTARATGIYLDPIFVSLENEQVEQHISVNYARDMEYFKPERILHTCPLSILLRADTLINESYIPLSYSYLKILWSLYPSIATRLA